MKKNIFLRALWLALFVLLAMGCGSAPTRPSGGLQPWDATLLAPGEISVREDGSRWLQVAGNMKVVPNVAPFFIPKNEDESYGILRNIGRVERLDIVVFWTSPGGTRRPYLLLVMQPGAILQTNIFPRGLYDLVVYAWRKRWDGWHTLGRHFSSFDVTDDPQRFTWPPGQREALTFVGWYRDLGPYADTDLNAPLGGRGPTLVVNLDFTGGDAIARAFTNWIYGPRYVTVPPMFQPYYPYPKLKWDQPPRGGGE